MNSALFDKVLNCPSLPSLPGVAMKVLELTRDPNVSLNRIAQTVQTDAAMSVKVLKTVNSSYYGLTTPCPSITRAMSMLGLNTVKAIVLGFSLVESTKGVGAESGFDMTAYWRRAVFSAASARAIALASRCCDPEEAFIAALLQDIGQLACVAAIRKEYKEVLNTCGPDHDEIAAVEKTELGFDHQKVGLELAQRWRLPPVILECISRHHNPAKSHPEHESVVRCVHLGGLAAGALTLADPRCKLGGFIQAAREWFKIDAQTSRDLIQQTATGAAELAKLLEISTGEAPDMTTLLAQAHEQMAEVNEAVQMESVQLRRNNDELARQTVTDGLTGAYNRAHFDRVLRTTFEQCKQSNSPMCVVFMDGDRFKSVNDTHGHQTGDAVLMEIAVRLKSVTPAAGVLCRYGGEEFAAVLPGMTLAQGEVIAEKYRDVVGGTPFDLTPHGVGLTLPITLSAGVSAMEPAFASLVTTPEQITHAADQGVYAAKAAGRNRVCTKNLSGASESSMSIGGHAPKPKVAHAAKTLMIVEDDPLASRLLSYLFAKCRDIKTVTVKSAEEAMDWVSAPSAACPRPDMVVCDLNLPGISGIQLISTLRGRCKGYVPFVIMTAELGEAEKAMAIAAGADACIDKLEFCRNTEQWLSRVMELIERSRIAA